MRFSKLLLIVSSVLFVALDVVQSKPAKDEDKKVELAPIFKPIEINEELKDTDPNDAKLGKPSRKYTVKLAKDKTYVIDLQSADFDAYLRLLDKGGKQLAEDDDGGGDLNSRIIHSGTENGDHQIVVTTFDGQVGKFNLKVRELLLKGEAKARTLEKNGIEFNGDLAQNDKTDLANLSKVLTYQLKPGQGYVFEIDSEDFDCELYVFDGKNKLLGHGPDKVFAGATTNGAHNLVVASFDNQVGKFNLKIREFAIKGEAKAREVGKDGISITANIAAGDASGLGKLGKIYSVQLKAGQTYTIDLESTTMDSYLYLFDGKTTLLAQDDDSGGDLNSRITVRAQADGVHHIVATTLGGEETGEFTLKIRKGE
jgi:hypothetical protein